MENDFTETTLSSLTAYRGKLLTVREDKIAQHDGRQATREYIVHQGAVMVLPLFDDYSLLLERQYRYALRTHTWELPAGKIEKGEGTLATAQRELLEETGYVAREWRFLRTIHPCVGYSDERIELFLARGLSHQGHPGEEGEFLDTIRISLDDALAMLDRGDITDSKTLFGLLWAERLRRQESVGAAS